MATEHREQVRIVRDEDIERKERVVERRPSMQRVILSRVSKLIWLIVGIITILITFRFILFLLAANPANSFASFIYAVTNPLVAPFMSLVAAPEFGAGSVIDVASLFAIVVYSVIAWAVVRFLYILFADTSGTRRVKTLRRERYD
jgi:uncharacterized protein YggT (Ycf19 family)